MTQDRACGCVCASLPLVGPPTPIRPSTSPAASSPQDHWLPVSIVSLADPLLVRTPTPLRCRPGRLVSRMSPMVAARCGSRLTRLAGVAGAPQTDDLVVLSGESREGLELGETRRCSREVHTPASSRPCPHESSESTAWVGTPASSNVVRPRHDHVRAHQAEWCVGWQPRN